MASDGPMPHSAAEVLQPYLEQYLLKLKKKTKKTNIVVNNEHILENRNEDISSILNTIHAKKILQVQDPKYIFE